MHYLDHAATTPLRPEAREAMVSCLEDFFGNPSSVHAYGREAREVVEIAREQVAAALGASPSEIVFTGGGTEADNIALKGVARKLRGNGRHIVTTAFEHHAVLDTAEWLHREGYEVTFVPVPPSGVLDPGAVAGAVRSDTILVSAMAVNNEIGTVQPVRAVTAAVKERNRSVLVHTDAVQALGNIPVDLREWGVDLASFAAHKLGGPKGVGALYVKAGTPVEAIVHGGGQERNLRSGTLNVAGIAGFGAAAEVAAREVSDKAERLLKMRTQLLEGIQASLPDVRVNGDLDARVAGNLHISIPGAEGETLLLLLDQEGIACSAGSACQSGALDPSHVLSAIGVPPEIAKGSVRFSLGWTSTEADVDAVIEVLPQAAGIARKAAG
ncbi:MAG TPA: cysteine desulfurase family protein [Actinomycetota bacterium]|jgi:cysteine desulfurase|nr:cysteine desulfurase family protein [Actinomycetota bacterium]